MKKYFTKRYLARMLMVLSLIGLVFALAFVGQYRSTSYVSVTYKIGEEIVHTQKIKKGSKIESLYTYESANHQSYASVWKDKDDVIYESTTIVKDNVELIGTVNTSLLLFTTEENVFVYVNGINHVHSDGKVVVLSSYYNKPTRIGLAALSNNAYMKELYLPAQLEKISADNFYNCSSLSTIYFEGTEEEWNAIPNDSEIPESIHLVFNTAITYS